jgi:hypothetical protein
VPGAAFVQGRMIFTLVRGIAVIGDAPLSSSVDHLSETPATIAGVMRGHAGHTHNPARRRTRRPRRSCRAPARCRTVMCVPPPSSATSCSGRPQAPSAALRLLKWCPGLDRALFIGHDPTPTSATPRQKGIVRARRQPERLGNDRSWRESCTLRTFRDFPVGHNSAIHTARARSVSALMR